MKGIHPGSGVLAVLVLLLSASSVRAAEDTIVSGQDAEQYVRVTDLKAQGSVVSGVLQNESPNTLRDVQLLIRRAWIWKNERHPGEDSPGRADFYTVSGEIPPHGTLPFTFRSAPLPHRSDGRFAEPVVQVVGYTEIGSSRTAGLPAPGER